MATISSPGIGSGLDIDGIITKLMAIEKQPLTALQTKAQTISSQISAFATMTSTLSTLSDAATKLSQAATWSAKSASSSNSTAVSASVVNGTTAAASSFSIEVSQLARIQSVSSGAVASGAAFGGGTLSVQLGSWSTSASSGSPSFAPGSAAAIDVQVTQGDTLSSIAAKINAAGAGVSATVLKDLSGERLMLRSTATGEPSGFRVQAAGDGTDGAALSDLAFDDPASGAGMAANAVQYARNAAATLNGVAISSASNTLSGTVEGMTFQLSQVTTAPVEITVASDATAQRAAVEGFVKAYNAMNQMLNSATKYDPVTQQAALLQGDSTAVGLQTALRNLVGSNAGDGALKHLSDLGVSLLKNGAGDLTVDGTKLDKALADPAAVNAFFVTAPGGATQGFGTRLAAFTQAAIGTTGAFATRTDSLQTQKTGNLKDQDQLGNRLTLTETRLRRQYTALDASLASLTALNTYVTQQIAQWNKSSN